MSTMNMISTSHLLLVSGVSTMKHDIYFSCMDCQQWTWYLLIIYFSRVDCQQWTWYLLLIYFWWVDYQQWTLYLLLLSFTWDWCPTIRLRTLSSRQWILSWTFLAPCFFFPSPFLCVLSFYNIRQGFIIMTHIEDKHAEEEHQGVIAAIGYFKFWVRNTCRTTKKYIYN